MISLAMIAGGEVVMKSNVSPRTSIPSLSIRNTGRLLPGPIIVLWSFSPSVVAHSIAGIVVEISAPSVVVPDESSPVLIFLK